MPPAMPAGLSTSPSASKPARVRVVGGGGKAGVGAVCRCETTPVGLVSCGAFEMIIYNTQKPHTQREKISTHTHTANKQVDGDY